MSLECDLPFEPGRPRLKSRHTPEFRRLSGTWTRLAAELESEQALLNMLSELEFDQPYYVLPVALKLQAA
jgi:hypothetical protein